MNTVDTPVFIPSSCGDLAAVVTLPAEGSWSGPLHVLLSGADQERSSRPLLRDTARWLASRGGLALRFDYPGVGFSPDPECAALQKKGPEARAKLVDITAEVLDWFVRITRVDNIVLTGTCLGARLALSLTARDTRVTQAALVSCPLGAGRQGAGPRARRRPRLRAGIAALESVGPLVADRLSRAPDNRPKPQWRQQDLDEFIAAGKRADLLFLYGTDEPLFEVFTQLTGAEEIDEVVRRRVASVALKDAHLHGLDNVEHHEWLKGQMFPFLDRASVQDGRGGS